MNDSQVEADANRALPTKDPRFEPAYTGGVTGPTQGKSSRGAVGVVIKTEEGETLFKKGVYIGDDVTVKAPSDPLMADVMMADFTSRPISAVERGERVIGWARPEVGKRRLVRAEVLSVEEWESPLVDVVLASGAVIRMDDNHVWGVTDSIAKHSQLRYRTAKPGRRMLRLFTEVPPLDPELAWHAGYLAGMYDGEGSERVIAQYQDANPISHKAIAESLEALALPFTPTPKGFYLVGGRDHFLRFLQWCQPRKIVRAGYWVNNDHLPGTMRPDLIVDVLPAGEGQVMGLRTSTGNYTISGFATADLTPGRLAARY